MSKLYIRSCFIITLLLLQSCALFIKNRPGPYKKWNNEKMTHKRPSVRLNMIPELSKNGEQVDLNENSDFLAVSVSRSELILKTYKESGLFSKVSFDDPSADLVADITYSSFSEQDFLLGLISGLTLTLVPDRRSESQTIRTVFRTKSGKASPEIIKENEITFWIHLPLLFAMPFIDSVDHASVELLRDMTNSSLADALKNGSLIQDE